MIMNIYRGLIIENGLLFSLFILIVLQSGCAQASSENVDRGSSYESTRSIVSSDIQRKQWGELRLQGVNRRYLLYTPESYNVQKPSPLIVVLHGGHGDAEKTADKTGFKPLAERDGFLVLYPEAVEKHWNDGRKTTVSKISDVVFISALVDHVAKLRNIDRQRIYVTGLSNGGMMTQRLACESPERYAAFASVIANMPLSMKLACKPGRPVAIMLIYGTEDPLMPYSGGEIKKGRRVGMGGTVISADETVKFWADNNHCKGDGNTTMLPDNDPDDDTRIEKTAFTECKDGGELIFYSVKGGGHAWPGSDIKPLMRRITGNVSNDMVASEVIWEFFQRQAAQ